jgi:hypothetical protein
MKDNKKEVIKLDITDKSLLDFKKTKSISVASSISDLKSSKIGELYDVKPIRDNMQRLCLVKIQGKSSKEVPIPKNVSKDICECLFEKNKELSYAELENRVLTRNETPASECITILDKYLEKNSSKHKSTKSTTSSKTTRKTSSKTTRKTSSKKSKKNKKRKTN